MNTPSSPTPSTEGLIRGISLWGAVSMLMGMIVGGGIFVTIGEMAIAVGPGLFLAYILAAVPMTFVCLYNIQLSSVLPVTGADFVVTTRTLPPLLGWLANWCAFVAGFLAMGILGLAFANTLQPALPGLPVPLLATGVILVFGGINLVGSRVGAGVQMILFWLLVMLPLVVFVGGGLPQIESSNLSPLFPKGHLPILIGAVAAIQAYAGLSSITFWAGEIRQARRNVPLTLGICLLLTLVLYVAVSGILTGVIPWEQVSTTGTLQTAAQSFLPEWGQQFIRWGSLFAAATTIHAILLVVSRNTVALARDRVLPGILGAVNHRFHSPHWAILFCVAGGAAFAVIGGGIYRLAVLFGVFSMFAHVVVATAVFLIPRQQPDLLKKAPLRFNPFWRWFTFLGMALFGAGFFVLGMLESREVAPLFLGVMSLAGLYWFLRLAYLKSRNIDLPTRLKSLSAEAEREMQED